MAKKTYIILLFVETPRKFITAKLSIMKESNAYGSKALQSFAVINLGGVSTNNSIITPKHVSIQCLCL